MSTLLDRDKTTSKLSRVEFKKHLQKRKIVRILYLKGTLTIQDINFRMKLSAPTTQGLLDELLAEGLVEIKGTGHSKGGRRPNLYGLKRNAFYILSIDIGRQSTRVSVFNNSNESITGVKFIPLLLENDIRIIDSIHNFASEIIRDSGIDTDKLVGIGIEMPGLVDKVKGVNYTYLNFEKPLDEIFRERFDRPVYILNDAQAKASAEFRFGLAIGKKNVLALHLGSGLGLGMILDGKTFYGSQGFSGEFSHIQMNEKGHLCNCGKRGCLETIASGIALTRNVISGLKKGEASSIPDRVNRDYDRITHKVILDAALAGDQFAINHLAEIGRELGKGVAILVQILNPELIILGGRLAEAGRYITLPMEQSLFQYAMPELRKNSKIVISKLGDKANLLGGVINVMENIFEN